MAVHLHHVYLVGIVIPHVLNDPSPMKALPLLGPLQIVHVCASTKPKSVRRHFCIILQYDASPKIDVMLLGTSRPRQVHRFVPCKGTMRLPYQPRHEVTLSPPSGLLSTSYFNFSHPLRATIFLQGDVILPCVPPQVFWTEKFPDGKSIDVFLSPSKIESLKSLHAKYWGGLRYNRDGSPIGGGGDESYGGGASGEGCGGASKQGGDGGSRNAMLRPLRSDGTITLPHFSTAEGGSGAQRLARALLEEDKRVGQHDLLEGDHSDFPAPGVLAFVQPLTMYALDLVDAL